MFPMGFIRLLLLGISRPFSVLSCFWRNLSRFSEREFSINKLQNKVIIITGANSGLGEALAHTCYEFGSHVVLCGRKQEELFRVKQELMAKNLNHQTHEPTVLILDLTKLTELDAKIKEVFEIYGRIDVLINNAGIGYRGEVVSTKLETDIRIMVTNYFGQVALTKAVLPFMQMVNSGSIVAISSIQGRISIPYRSSYSASKHALQAFFDCLRSEVDKDRIHICVVSPGYIRTNLSFNAVTGSGKNYGRMDPSTASGMEPKAVAFEIIKAVILKKKEIVVTPFSNKIGLLLRNLIPSLYFYIMSLRASRIQIECDSDENVGRNTDVDNLLPKTN